MDQNIKELERHSRLITAGTYVGMLWIEGPTAEKQSEDGGGPDPPTKHYITLLPPQINLAKFS